MSIETAKKVLEAAKGTDENLKTHALYELAYEHAKNRIQEVRERVAKSLFHSEKK